MREKSTTANGFHSRRAYTMIEMMVVVAAIVIVSALLFPMFKKMRDSGKKVKCLSNLRQLGVAMNLYLQDDRQGRFPKALGGCVDVRDLPELLYIYLGQENANAFNSGELMQFRCPKALPAENPGTRIDGPDNQVDYSINCNLWGEAAVSTIGNDTIAVILYDYGVKDSTPITYVHQNGANFLFVDGHAQWLPDNRINSAWPNVDQYAGTNYEDWGLQ